MSEEQAMAEMKKLGGYWASAGCLDLSFSHVTDAGLEHLKGLTDLQWLDLRNAEITDAGLEHLKGLKLQELLLTNTHVTDAGLKHLKGLTKLQRLFLNGTQVTDTGINDLREAFPNLNIVR